jgi:hypothetical protein
LRSSAAAPVPVTRKRSRQSCSTTNEGPQTICPSLHRDDSPPSSLILDCLFCHFSLSDTDSRGKRRSSAPDHRALSQGIFSQVLFAVIMLTRGKPARQHR